MPYGEDITINVGDAVRIHPNYKNYKFKKLKYGVTYFVKELHTDYTKKIRYLETEKGDTILLNMDQTYFEHAGKESFGEVPMILLNTKEGLTKEDELVGKEFQVYGQGIIYKLHNYSSEKYIVTLSGEEVSSSSSGIHEKDVVRQRVEEGVWVLMEGQAEQPTEDSYSLDHYDLYYTLTEKDIEAGKIKVDAYWVAKQWKTGSRDDSGALWHSLKTIARFGEKNDKAREIKALYNQAIALARIYDVEL